MRTTALTMTLIGLLCVITGILTAFNVLPALVPAMFSLSALAVTALFWWLMAGLILLAAIAFGIVAGKE